MHSDLEMKLIIPKFHAAKDGHLKMHSDLEIKLLALICYHDIDHKVEWKQSGIEVLHPALVYCLLLEFSLMKGVWKLCIQIHSISWFADWFATWFTCWNDHWLL
jgi:hypothetical protein